ncbi:MAG: RNA polymerase sporulation sigma factor SigK [Bacilli bacterium]|nr:RNA polymerase sporulation sigma factor SigK [Bacilli bacterium]
MFNFIKKLFKDFYIFSAAYSNNSFPDPLTKEEEDLYVEKAKLGDKEARSKLIEHNLRLVAHIVKKYDSKNEDTDDLISIGTIGLIKGVDSYSKKKNTRLTTYAARCIENEILMHFRNNKKRSKDISINESVGFDKEGNEITILDILKTPAPDFALDIHKEDNITDLKKYLCVLTQREKEIIIDRYGLYDNDEITQKEIAKKLGISRSYVSRIEKRALTKMLREFLKNNKDV